MLKTYPEIEVIKSCLLVFKMEILARNHPFFDVEALLSLLV